MNIGIITSPTEESFVRVQKKLDFIEFTINAGDEGSGFFAQIV